MFSFSVEGTDNYLEQLKPWKPFVIHLGNGEIVGMLGKCVHNGYL